MKIVATETVRDKELRWTPTFLKQGPEVQALKRFCRTGTILPQDPRDVFDTPVIPGDGVASIFKGAVHPKAACNTARRAGTGGRDLRMDHQRPRFSCAFEQDKFIERESGPDRDTSAPSREVQSPPGREGNC